VSDERTVLTGGTNLTVDDLHDLHRVLSWIERQGLPHSELSAAAPVGGGTQNVMIRFTCGGRAYVLRRGPRHLRDTTNAALSREIEILGALASTAVPHPRLIASCTDVSVLGDSVFYVMEPVDGVNAFVEISDLHRTDAEVRRQIGFELVDALVALGEIDPVTVGLDHIGRPDGFLGRQVDRWLSELDGYYSSGTYERGLPGVGEIATWLHEHQPTTNDPGLMHGDFHLGNVMIEPDGPRVAAIVDWEMCTVGDPLLDLGWLLATWQQADGSDLSDSKLAAAGGLATTDELIAHYSSRSTRDLGSLTWYRVLACFKLGVLLEGTYARSLGGQAPKELGRWMHTRAIRLFRQAHQLIN
jgi:aminoglycoside phosphotransferase (APT) family kinase protein